MSALTDQFEADVAAVETDLPATFTFNGRDYTGSKDVSALGLAMAEAGYDTRRRTVLVVRRSVFVGALPTTNSEITLDGETWRVDGQPEKSQDGITLTLQLVQST